MTKAKNKKRLPLSERFSRSDGVLFCVFGPTVPYARGFVERGQLVKCCPICGKQFVEQTDATGEQMSSTYEGHFMRNHDPFMTADEVKEAVLNDR